MLYSLIFNKIKLFFIAGSILFLWASVLFMPRVTFAAVSDWQQGVTIFPRWNTDFSSESFKHSVSNAAGTGANYITLHIPLHQSNIYSTDIQTGVDTPTDQSLVDGINYIHSQGMKVMLKFQVVPYDGNWSAYINPGDRDAWFNNYTFMLAHYMQIAQNLGVEEVGLGTELISMTSATVNGTNTQNWINLIANIRGMYSGQLTYSSNWGGDSFTNEKANINFWSSLDHIGIAAYFNLSGEGSVASLMQSWHTWNMNDITPLYQRWGKPIIFTEVGYKNIYDSYTHPWMWWQGGGSASEQQARDYEALFKYWNDYGFMQGVHWWEWSSDPNAGGSGDIGYTPQNKPAQVTMTTWFTQPQPPSELPPGGGTPATYEINATMSPGSPGVGVDATFRVNVTNKGGISSGDIVDIEIYNSSGTKVFQKIFEEQSFALNSSQTYSAIWTPSVVGSYVLKAGVFSGGWSTLYYWGDAVLSFTVSSGGGTPPPPQSSGGIIDIWWPTDGRTVSGVLPFKAMLQDASVDTYKMFWQVDHGVLNIMESNFVEYPHKEALVDVSGWSWHGIGPYLINFVTQDLSGQVTAQKAININISR